MGLVTAAVSRPDLLVQWGEARCPSDFSVCRAHLGRRVERQISAWEVCGRLEHCLSNKLQVMEMLASLDQFASS